MKNLKIKFDVPLMFIIIDDDVYLKTSMILSTISVITLLTIMPWAVPIFMANTQRSWL